MNTDAAAPEWLKEGSKGPLLLLAHGAGAPMDSEFMASLSTALVRYDVRVWRFEFGYMAQRRLGGSRRPPPAAGRLLEEWRQVVAAARHESGLFVGGKSMGGRLASMLAAELPRDDSPLPVTGCLCFGYPFYPPAKPEQWRTGHFTDLPVPTLVLQGERDTFGKRERVCGHLDDAARRSGNLAIQWISEGDHDLRPPKRSPATWESNLDQAAREAAGFMHRLGKC